MVNLWILMASWSTKRKYGYFLVVLGILALAIGIPFFFFFYKAPTCYDGKQNGGERGIDCGGACAKLCPADFASPRVLWAYSARVVPGVYNLLAYVQNPNQAVEATSLSYMFKMYDDEGILVAQKEGRTFVPAGQKFAIFENGVRTGERAPAITTFEFTDIPDWRRGEIFSQVRLLSVNLDQDGNPSAEAKIKNDTVDRSFSNVTAFIVLYNKDDNRVNFSKTIVDSLAPGEQKSIYFTWPEPLSEQIVRSEVLFVANPR